jgi:hypothetical protein
MLQWVSADLASGRVIADLPALDVDWPLRDTISDVDTATMHLQLDGAPENWLRATEPGAAVLACYDDRDESLPIQWAGYVTMRHRDGAQDVVDLSVATLEAYLDRRYVPDRTYSSGWRAIVNSLVVNYVQAGPLGGIALQVSYDGAGTAPDTAFIWQNTDNASVKNRIDQLIGQFGGEYTIRWAWSADSQSIVPTLYLADRLGSTAAAGLGPSVTFEMPGAISAVSMDEDYSAGSGANTVVAYSSGQGDYTPYAPPVTSTAAQDRPTFEFRYSPVPSETRTSRLQSFARQALSILGAGARTFSLSIDRSNDEHVRYGVDWQLGDDIGYSIGGTGPDGRDLVTAFPGGLTGVARPIAVEVGENDVTPIFAQPQLQVSDGA